MKKIAEQLRNTHHLSDPDSYMLLSSTITSMMQDDATGSTILANSNTGETFEIDLNDHTSVASIITAAIDKCCNLIIIDGGNTSGDNFKLSLSITRKMFYYEHQN